MTAPIITIPVEGQRKRRCSFGVVVIRAFKLTVSNFLSKKKKDVPPIKYTLR